MMDIYVTRNIRHEGLDLLKQAQTRFQVWPGAENAGPTKGEILQGVGQARVLLTLLTEAIDRDILTANPRLLGVANYAVGYNNIDVKAATALGIPVTNTPGVLTETTADLTWALLMAVARQVPQSHAYMVGGHFNIWGPNLFLGSDVGPGPCGKQKTLGIVGFGRIGQAVYRRALGFNMRILVFAQRGPEVVADFPGATFASLEQLLRQSDFVTLQCSLSEKTKYLIGQNELAMMKPTAYLINTSRGPVVDEAALVTALQKNRIAGAGLDVYEEEPRMAKGLAELSNVVLLPHIGSATTETRGEMAILAARNALALLRKERAPNTVNPEVYETAAYQKRLQD